MRLQKGLKLLLVIGLLVVLFLVNQIKSGMGLKSKAIVLFSKYRALLPYMVAQSKHESANYTSKVYLTDNNMFGIKWINSPSQKATKGLLSPEGNHYAHFASDTDSLVDLLRIFEVKKFPVSVESADQYAKELQSRGYFTDGLANYTNGLKRFLS
jgi:flagellum-specific peptidoglycan hydrolase FlgJ